MSDLSWLDESLFVRLRRKEPEALGTVFRQTQSWIYRTILASVRDTDTAEELTAETYFRLLDSANEIRGPARVLPRFLLGVARNLVREHLRERGRFVEFQEDVEGNGSGAGTATALGSVAAGRVTGSADIAAVSADDPIDRLSDAERLERAWSFLGELKPVEREVAMLRFVEGWSIRDVAQAIGAPEGTVKSHIHRIRERLRAMEETLDTRMSK